MQCPSSWSPLTLRDLSHSVLCLCTKPETSSLTHTLRIGNLLSPYSPGLPWCSEGPRVLQSSLNRETVDYLLATKARADASASTVDRPGLHFSSRTDLGGSGSVGYEMEFWLGGVGVQQHTRDAGGHREIPLHLIPPPPNSGISPAPPDQPFPAPAREEPGRAKPQAGLPGWWPRELAPSARVPPGRARISSRLGRPTKLKPGPRAQAGRAPNGAGRGGPGGPGVSDVTPRVHLGREAGKRTTEMRRPPRS